MLGSPRKNRRRIGKIGHHEVRALGGQFLVRVPPRGDGDDAGADRSGTADIQRRIAENPDTFAIHTVAQPAAYHR